MLVAHDVGSGNGETVLSAEENGVVLKRSQANFRAWEILEDGDWLPDVCRHDANTPCGLSMLSRGAVREIEPQDVSSCLYNLA
jgi:hypothetical protein